MVVQKGRGAGRRRRLGMGNDTLALALLFLTLNGGQRSCLSSRERDYEGCVHSYVRLVTLRSEMGVVCIIL